MKLHKLIVNGLAVISLIVVIWINFFQFLYISGPEWINAENFNRLIENIAIAYITSYLFYVVVVVFKTKQDNKLILPLVADYTFVMLNNCMTFCFSMRNAAGLEYIQMETSIYNRELKIYPNKEELKGICSKINPNEIISENVGDFVMIPTFFGKMINYIHRIDHFLKIVLNQSRFLDTELLRLLTHIQTHGFHQEMISYDKSMILTAKHRKNNLKLYENSMLSYFELYIKLEKYAESNLKNYVERESLKIPTIPHNKRYRSWLGFLQLEKFFSRINIITGRK